MYFFSFFVFFRYILSVFFSYSIEFCFFLQSYSDIDFTILRKKCPYSELFWSVFSHIWTEMRENEDQNNSEYRHFSRSTILSFFSLCFILLQTMLCIYRELSFAGFLCFLYNTVYHFRLFFLIFLDGIFFDMS